MGNEERRPAEVPTSANVPPAPGSDEREDTKGEVKKGLKWVVKHPIETVNTLRGVFKSLLGFGEQVTRFMFNVKVILVLTLCVICSVTFLVILLFGVLVYLGW